MSSEKGIYSKAQVKVPCIYGLINGNRENVSERNKMTAFRLYFLDYLVLLFKKIRYFCGCLFISKKLKSSFLTTERHHNHELSLYCLKYTFLMTVSHFETWLDSLPELPAWKYMSERMFLNSVVHLQVFTKNHMHWMDEILWLLNG